MKTRSNNFELAFVLTSTNTQTLPTPNPRYQKHQNTNGGMTPFDFSFLSVLHVLPFLLVLLLLLFDY